MRTRTVQIIAAALLAFMVFGACSGASVAHAAAADAWTGIPRGWRLAGSIGDSKASYAIQADIRIINSQVMGEYYYLSSGKLLEIYGDLKGTAFDASEYERWDHVTGKWTGKIDMATGRVTGTWTSPDESRSFSIALEPVASYVWDARVEHRIVDVDSSLPVFSARTRIASSAEDLAASVSAAAQKAALADLPLEYAPDPSDPDRGDQRWAVSTFGKVVYWSDSVISMMHEIYTFSGGAHGMTAYESINTWMQNGTPKRVYLQDVLLNGSGYQKAIEKHILADLKAQGAAFVASGEVQSVPEESLERFVLLPKGIAFYFGPYEMGSYAEGVYVSIVPWKTLTPYLNANGPAADLMKVKF
ncbi:MAG: DUF3298 domain-containing protein [Clostridia bacterium]|nr:DUF3298 domain-containing protein [Clostridia bacterium]